MTCTQGHMLRRRDCPNCGQLDPPPTIEKAPVPPGALDADPAKSRIADTDDLARGRIPVLSRHVVAKLADEMCNRGDVEALKALLLEVYDRQVDQLANLDVCDREQGEVIERQCQVIESQQDELARAAEVIRRYRNHE